jgi:predicted nucleotidyltransferase component of viral defense system
MIPLAFIQQWTASAPWSDLRQVEQDLIISRALCDLFTSPALRDRIAFRGGTAIHKLLFQRPLRYSEDIDLVQTRAEPIGDIIDGIRNALSWLGKCRRTQTQHSIHLVFKFSPESGGGEALKLKIEVNTREHQSRFGLRPYPFTVESDWHQARAEILSFEPDEIFGTKLRAFLQRNKNRDLFDLNEGLMSRLLDTERLLDCFHHYLALEGHLISRANVEERMLQKLTRSLTEDVTPLLPPGVRFDDADAAKAFGRVWGELVSRLAGESWKSAQSVIDTIRRTTIPDLLDGVERRGSA